MRTIDVQYMPRNSPPSQGYSRADLAAWWLLAMTEMGHEDAFPAAKAERPLSVQSRDLRGDVEQPARRADSGHSRPRPERGGWVKATA